MGYVEKALDILFKVFLFYNFFIRFGKQNTNTMNTTSFAFLEAKGKSKVWMAYANHFAGEDIMEEGFNSNSGYVYIALENGITIGSCLGQDVEFITTDFDSGEENFYDSYDELMEALENS